MAENVNYALHYQRWHRPDEAYFREWHRLGGRSLTRLVGKDKSARILDIGCGFGLSVYSLRASGYMQVSGVDIDAHQIGVARSLGLPCTQVSGTTEEAFYAALAGSVDVVLMFDLLEHIPKERQIAFLRRVRSLLNSGGFVVLRVPNALGPCALYQRYVDHTHYCSFTIESLDFVLMNSGFAPAQILKQREFTLRPLRKLPWLLVRYALLLFTRAIWRAAYVGELGRPGFSFRLTRDLLVRAQLVVTTGQ